MVTCKFSEHTIDCAMYCYQNVGLLIGCWRRCRHSHIGEVVVRDNMRWPQLNILLFTTITVKCQCSHITNTALQLLLRCRCSHINYCVSLSLHIYVLPTLTYFTILHTKWLTLQDMPEKNGPFRNSCCFLQHCSKNEMYSRETILILELGDIWKDWGDLSILCEKCK